LPEVTVERPDGDAHMAFVAIDRKHPKTRDAP
jgi:hypothetical protein